MRRPLLRPFQALNTRSIHLCHTHTSTINRIVLLRVQAKMTLTYASAQDYSPCRNRCAISAALSIYAGIVVIYVQLYLIMFESNCRLAAIMTEISASEIVSLCGAAPHITLKLMSSSSLVDLFILYVTILNLFLEI